MSSKSLRHFELTSDTSNKFWEVSAAGRELTTRWGKIGTKGQTKTKELADAEAAETEKARLIKEKLAEGYVESKQAKAKSGAESKPKAGRPSTAKAAKSVADSWRRIDAWLAQHAPGVLSRLGKGASPQAIARAEKSLGMELPDDVRASYAIHNGSGAYHFFPAGNYLTLVEMVRDYKFWQEALDERGDEHREYQPKGPIRPIYFSPKWIPVIGVDGDYVLIDLDPAEGGTVGQIIDYGHERGPERFVSESFAAYLAEMADTLESGVSPLTESQLFHPNSAGSFSWSMNQSAGATFPTLKDQDNFIKRNKYDVSRRRFKKSSGRSQSFWEVRHGGSEIITGFGNSLSYSRFTSKTYATEEKAAKALDQLIARKVKEGYREEE